jgi:4-hydroxy-3-methylbut-2-enyl diphosphate reductase
MHIIRADHLGMCFGVRDAITMALHEAAAGRLTILGELVHNETVLAELRARGVQIEAGGGPVRTPAVMITAHGASERAKQRARETAPRLIEATCPLVAVAHRAVQRLVADGFHPIIIGVAGHVEVRGLTEDLDEFDVVLSPEDVFRLAERPRFGIAAQTTQPIERVHCLVELIREQFPRSEVLFMDTVCQPTKQRQTAASELAGKCDVVIVIGGANSNNTRELVATCRRHCARVHHVQTAADLQSKWFSSAQTCGITAGTSTPDSIIDAVEERIVELAQGGSPAHLAVSSTSQEAAA